MKNKVLIISYDFYPDNSPNTYRWFNVLQKWSLERNLEIFVISSAKMNLARTEEIEGIKIFRTQHKLIDFARQFLGAKNKTTTLESTFKEIKSKSRFSILKSIYDITWKKLYFPDFAFHWRKSVFKKAQEIIDKEKITNLITVSWPFSAHVVGSELKKKYNLFWLADTIDPFYLSTTVNNTFLYRKLNFRLEKEVLSYADRVTVLTKKLKEEYSFIYPKLAGKLEVNHNLFVPSYKPLINSLIDVSKVDVLKFIFVGTLNRKNRNPLNTINFLKNFLKNSTLNKHIEFYFYGNLGDFNDSIFYSDPILKKHVFLKGFVVREDIPMILESAFMLLNIGNKNEFQEPSKILEFVYLKKPILNICQIENDTSKTMLQNYPSTFNVLPSETTQKETIIRFDEFCLQDHFISNSEVEKILEIYLLSEVEKRYYNLLKN